MGFLRKSGDSSRRKPPSELLNLGCGAHFHSAWTNVDFHAAAPSIMVHDLRAPLPFADESFTAVYSSHVLEHFSRAAAPRFLTECRRVLKPGGILRVVVPDLETIARLYLQTLAGALAGDAKSAARYEWMTLELLDQMTREESGGEMLKYWKRRPMPEQEFVVERLGWEVRRVLDEVQSQPPKTTEPTPAQTAKFRETGELHKWMYDRWSLRQLLESCGFVECRVSAASDSRIPDFNGYKLDLNADGSVRKPDSLFMEGLKK